MRYGDRGGVDQAEQARRERVRQRAAELFVEGMSAVEVAGLLEVSTKSAHQWRRAWVAGGAQALASKGSSGPDSEGDEPFPRPALILTGRQDNVTGYAEQHALLPHYTRATFAVLDVAGHNLHIEQPILFEALVEEWLERVREGQSRLSGKAVQQRSTSQSAFDLPWRGHLVTPVVRCRRFDVDDVVELVVESGVEAIPLPDGPTSRVGGRRPGGGSVGGAELGAVLRPAVG
jgi:hypothetical protein